MSTPVVGVAVHYIQPGMEPLAGMITAVDSSGRVNLAVWDASGSPMSPRSGMLFVDAGRTGPPGSTYCTPVPLSGSGAPGVSPQSKP